MICSLVHGWRLWCLVAAIGCGRIGFDADARDANATDGRDIDAPVLSINQLIGATGDDRGLGVTRGPNGSYVAVGLIASTVQVGSATLVNAGGLDAVVIALEPSGAHRWARSFGTPTNDGAFGVATDADDNLYVIGYTTGSIDFGGGPLASTVQGGFVASFTADGSYRWARTISSATGGGVAHGVAVRGATVAVSGYVAGTVDFGAGPTPSAQGVFTAYVLALDTATGSYQWAHRATDVSLSQSQGLAASDAGFFVAGVFDGAPSIAGSGPLPNQGSQDGFLVALDPAGAFRWVRTIGGPTVDSTVGAAVTAAGDVIAVGRFTGTIDPGSPATAAGVSDGFVISYAADGTFRWLRTLGVAGCARLNRVTAVSDTDLVVTGMFTDTIVTAAGEVTSAGAADGLLLGITASGQLDWAQNFGGTEDEVAMEVAGTGRGSLLVTGSANRVTDPTCISSVSGEQDFYLASF